MTQNASDVNVANALFPNFRSDLNNILQDITTLFAGTSEPTTTYANQLWYETDTNLLKMRSEADDAWINVAFVCQSTGKFCILDDTDIRTTAGAVAGLLGDQSTSVWETGTGTTESLVSPAKIRAAINAWDFESTVTNTGGGSYTVAHGLAAVPSDFTVVAVCKQATGNVTVGAEIPLKGIGGFFRDTVPTSGTSSTTHQGISVWVDDTNVYLHYVPNTGAFGDFYDGSSAIRFNQNSNADFDFTVRARL